MTDICRLCASLKILDQLTSIAEPNLRLVEKLARCCSLELSPDELMPQSICQECVLSIDSSWNFAEKVCQAQDILKKAFIICSVKNDDLDEPRNSFNGTIFRNKVLVNILSRSRLSIQIVVNIRFTVAEFKFFHPWFVIESPQHDHIIAQERIRKQRNLHKIEFKCEASCYQSRKYFYF